MRTEGPGLNGALLLRFASFFVLLVLTFSSFFVCFMVFFAASLNANLVLQEQTLEHCDFGGFFPEESSTKQGNQIHLGAALDKYRNPSSRFWFWGGGGVCGLVCLFVLSCID